jgi:hypothetical protein
VPLNPAHLLLLSARVGITPPLISVGVGVGPDGVFPKRLHAKDKINNANPQIIIRDDFREMCFMLSSSWSNEAALYSGVNSLFRPLPNYIILQP